MQYLEQNVMSRAGHKTTSGVLDVDLCSVFWSKGNWYRAAERMYDKRSKEVNCTT